MQDRTSLLIEINVCGARSGELDGVGQIGELHEY